MDRLETFIKDNRSTFDSENAPNHLWSKIDDALCERQKSDLELFIGSNRTAMDVADPASGVWEKIDESLTQMELKSNSIELKTIKMWPRYMARFAAAAVLLLGGVGIGMQLSKPTADDSLANALTHEQAQAIGALEYEVNSKMRHVATFVHQNPEVKADLDLLDKAAAELKQDLKDVPPGNRKQVVHAMLENYKAKVHILERILSRNIESEPHNETHKSDKHERTEI